MKKSNFFQNTPEREIQDLLAPYPDPMGRTDFPGGSYEQLMASLKRLGQLPGDYHVLPGHMGASTLETERKTNYYMREAMA